MYFNDYNRITKKIQLYAKLFSELYYIILAIISAFYIVKIKNKKQHFHIIFS